MEINPNNPDSYFNNGLCLAEMNNLTEAKDDFKKAVELKPDYAYAYYALGLAYEKEKDIPSAIENYELFVKYIGESNIKTNVQNKINNLKKKLPVDKAE